MICRQIADETLVILAADACALNDSVGLGICINPHGPLGNSYLRGHRESCPCAMEGLRS